MENLMSNRKWEYEGRNFGAHQLVGPEGLASQDGPSVIHPLCFQN